MVPISDFVRILVFELRNCNNQYQHIFSCFFFLSYYVSSKLVKHNTIRTFTFTYQPLPVISDDELLTATKFLEYVRLCTRADRNGKHSINILFRQTVTQEDRCTNKNTACRMCVRHCNRIFNYLTYDYSIVKYCNNCTNSL